MVVCQYAKIGCAEGDTCVKAEPNKCGLHAYHTFISNNVELNEAETLWCVIYETYSERGQGADVCRYMADNITASVKDGDYDQALDLLKEGTSVSKLIEELYGDDSDQSDNLTDTDKLRILTKVLLIGIYGDDWKYTPPSFMTLIAQVKREFYRRKKDESS
jgi:hypothetical protein